MRDLVGRTLGHYRIVERLGAGGMGVVYRTRDERLDRDVAVKVLPEEVAHDAARLARFEREARAVAKLEHPNILAIHDFGTEGGVAYAVTELLEGETLRQLIPSGGLSWQRAAEITAAIAEGLAAAHGKGIVHRDLKPENVFLTRDGRVKILDFGLAREVLPANEEAETASMTPACTVPGAVLGTVGYMSPEQVRGEGVDARSDIFSLGCVLYELLAGRRAFVRDTAAETMTAILKEEPPALAASGVTLPAELERHVRRCLEKRREARFQSASDLAFALRSMSSAHALPAPTSTPAASAPRHRRVAWFGTGAAVLLVAASAAWLLRARPAGTHRGTAPPRIVVLPFENLGPAEDAYFADGMAEEITARLAAVSGLRVISRTSARQYAHTGRSIPEIGKELDVDYVLEGTVRWAGGAGGRSRIRVTPQLIRVADDTHLWADTYDREIDDVFDIQSVVAQSVTDHLGVSLGGAERTLVEAQPTANLEAYQAYLRGRHWASQPHFTSENWDRVMRAYRQAAELDPDFALAHAELARGHALLRYYRYDLTPERLRLADHAAQRALALAPDSPRVHLDVGYYRLWAYRDVKGALAEFTRAGAGLPDNADVLEAKGHTYILEGRWDEAVDSFRRAFDLSPRDAEIISNVAWALWTLRRYPEAITAADEAIRLAPDTLWPYLFKALTLWSWHGAPSEARPVLEGLPETTDDWVRWAWYWQERFEGRDREAIGRLKSAREGWLRVKMFVRPNALLAAYAFERLGERDTAKEAYRMARELLEAEAAAAPEDPRLHSSLGIVYAKEGRREDAIREGKLACELLPRSRDGFYYIPYAIDLAHIYAILGETEEALEQLRDLLENPSWVSAPFLRMDPRWDPLRADPRFKALLEGHRVEP